MNIKILDSWLREYLKTKSSAKEIADQLSLTSVSVERLEKVGEDFIYDIEVTTNRPDLMSVIGIAREASAVLSDSQFIQPKISNSSRANLPILELEIKNDPKLVNRVLAVALEVNLGESPKKVKERVEASDIRAINNAVDVTNYVMREVGHPMHVFDYDKLLKFGKFLIRTSKPGEKIETLDDKTYELKGGDIVADDGKGNIIDLLAVMGTKNSAVDDNTKRVMFFVDNCDANRVRKTSMSLGIRSEAAILNEKGVDPELAQKAILRGVALLEQIADAEVISKLHDEYPNKPKVKSVSITEEKINSVIGIETPLKTSVKILEDLGFETSVSSSTISAKVPSWRLADVDIPEDLIEEIARIYGYFQLPSVLSSTTWQKPYQLKNNQFYWEDRAREALKYWGFTEVYTYPMVSENLLEEAPENSVVIKNPLTEDHVYMRRTLVPSLLEAVRENKNKEELKLFEIANVYIKKPTSLPDEQLRLAGVYKKPRANFLDVKGITEQMLNDLGIKDLEFKPTKSGAQGSDIYVGKDYLGEIEILEQDLIDFELEFDTILKHVSNAKIYKPVSKFPEAVEDLRFEIDETIPYDKIVRTIKNVSELVKNVYLLDIYKNTKTFRVIYQSNEKNLTADDITSIREKIISVLFKSLRAKLV